VIPLWLAVISFLVGVCDPPEIYGSIEDDDGDDILFVVKVDLA
jgi:hypothetical protein